MDYGICTLAYIPGRAEPKDSAEMTTQLVFGETYRIVKITPKWVFIRTEKDQYDCWIDYKQVNEIDWKSFEEINNNHFPVVTNNHVWLSNKENQRIDLPIGAILPFFHQNQVRIKGDVFNVHNFKTHKPEWSELPNIYHKSTYLWGGKTQWGLDCSGFSQMAYRLRGIDLLRDAYQQEEDERFYTTPFNEQQTGDLAFFRNKKGRTTHVGIILSPNLIMHASGYLRVDRLNEQGIIDDQEQLTHILTSIKRYEHS